MDDKQISAYGITLKVPEKDKIEFISICNLFDDYTMLNIPNRINSNISINPKSINAFKDFDFSQEFLLSIRGNYTDEQIRLFNEWRI